MDPIFEGRLFEVEETDNVMVTFFGESSPCITGEEPIEIELGWISSKKSASVMVCTHGVGHPSACCD